MMEMLKKYNFYDPDTKFSLNVDREIIGSGKTLTINIHGIGDVVILKKNVYDRMVRETKDAYDVFRKKVLKLARRMKQRKYCPLCKQLTPYYLHKTERESIRRLNDSR